MQCRRGQGVAVLLILGVACALLPGGVPAVAAEADPLEDGVPRVLVLPAGLTMWSGRITVPEKAVALSVVVCSKGDVDLYLRRGSAMTAAFAAESDVVSRSDGILESIRVTPDGDVPLRPGIWHVAVVNPRKEDVEARFEIVAFVDKDDGLRTVLPGEDVTQNLEPRAGHAELRTLLPTLARSLTLELEGADGEAIRYHLSGPRDHTRSGRAPRRIVLHSADSPPGAYVLDLEADPGDSLPQDVQVRARWHFAARDEKEDPVLEEPRPIVRPGSSVTVTLGGPGQPTTRNVRIPIREGTGGFLIEATNPTKLDVDLYVRRGRPLDMGDDDADYFALSSAPSERLVVGGVRALRRAIYYCELVLVDGKGPARVTVRVRTFPLSSVRGTWGEQEPPAITPGTWTRGRVEAGLAGVTWYSVKVPRGVRSLHAVLLNATAPLDLVLARWTDGSIMRRALTARVDERIDHVFPAPLDGPRRFLLGVMNRNPYEEVVGYRAALSFDRPPALPADFTWPPVMRVNGENPTMRVAAATVELTVERNTGGSGTCVSPRGRILTCRHVLRIEESKPTIQREGILVAFPERLDLPPVQSFVARVTHDDEQTDLALLEVTADIFGRRLPKDLSLPWVPLGDSSTVELGDPVLVFGYPSEGSERIRTPVILTRGTVAGLETLRGRRRWIKTDAWVGLGHSGGSLVDAKLRLVGVAAATLGAGEVLGLAVPVSVLPAEWTAHIRSGAGR